MKITHFLTRNVVGIIVIGLFTSVLGAALYEHFPFIGPDSKTRPSEKKIFAKCSKGERPSLPEEAFLVRFVAVQDSQVLRDEMDRQTNDFPRTLADGVRSGKFQRISKAELLTVHIQDVSLVEPGLEVPLLVGEGVCERMVSVDRVQDRELRFVIPVGPEAAQTAVAFPRKLFENSPNVRICAEPSFWLANATETRQNMYCAVSVAPSAARGVLARTFVLIRAT